MDHSTPPSKLVEQLRSDLTEIPVSALSRLRGFSSLAARGMAQSLAERVGRHTSYIRPNPEATEKTVFTLGRLKGLPMKIGQLWSYADPSITDERRATLSVLQRWAQPVSYLQIRRVIAEDLGKQGTELIKSLERVPISVASIGQVHRAKLPDGTRVAVKVRYPGIDQAIVQDFRPASVSARLMAWIDQPAQRDVLVRELLTRLKEECDYRREAKRQQHFARCFIDHPTVVIPEVFEDYSGPSVLTTRWVEGVHFHEFLRNKPSQEQRDRAGTALFDFYYGSLFAHGVYNCDPHPGNYLFCADGRVAIVDHGCARVFDPLFIKNFVALTRAVQDDNRQRIRDALLAIGFIQSGQPYNHEVARRLLHWFFGPLLRGPDSLFEMDDVRLKGLIKKRRLRHFAIPSEFLFLLRMRVGIAAVLTDLEARADWKKIQTEYLEEAEEQLAQPKPFTKRSHGYDVVLLDSGNRIIELIRELRDHLEITVGDAKTLVDQAPSTIESALHRGVAQQLQAKLESLGARVELRRVIR